MARKESLFSNLVKFFDQLFSGGAEEKTEVKTIAEDLQLAAKKEMELAQMKGKTASIAIYSTGVARKELNKLVMQHTVLKEEAVKAEKEGNTERAKKILALCLAVEDKIKQQTTQYESSDQTARALILEAQKQYQNAKNASNELPRKVLQVEINQMMEESQKLELATSSQITGKSFKALADEIDLKSTALMTKNLLIEGNNALGLEGEIEEVMKEAVFESAYKQLQAQVQQGAITIEGEVVEDDPIAKATKALSKPPFGGLLQG